MSILTHDDGLVHVEWYATSVGYKQATVLSCDVHRILYVDDDETSRVVGQEITCMACISRMGT